MKASKQKQNVDYLFQTYFLKLVTRYPRVAIAMILI